MKSTTTKRAVEVERFAELLRLINACDEAHEWCKGKTFAETWRACPRFDWMTYLIEVLHAATGSDFDGWRWRIMKGTLDRITRIIMREVCGVSGMLGLERLMDRPFGDARSDRARWLRVWPVINTWPYINDDCRDRFYELNARLGLQQLGEASTKKTLTFYLDASKKPCRILRREMPTSGKQTWLWYDEEGQA